MIVKPRGFDGSRFIDLRAHLAAVTATLHKKSLVSAACLPAHMHLRVRVTCGRAERGMECCWCGQTTKRVHAAGQAMHIVAAKKAKARGIVMPPTREEPPK